MSRRMERRKEWYVVLVEHNLGSSIYPHSYYNSLKLFFMMHKEGDIDSSAIHNRTGYSLVDILINTADHETRLQIPCNIVNEYILSYFFSYSPCDITYYLLQLISATEERLVLKIYGINLGLFELIHFF